MTAVDGRAHLLPGQCPGASEMLCNLWVQGLGDLSSRDSVHSTTSCLTEQNLPIPPNAVCSPLSNGRINLFLGGVGINRGVDCSAFSLPSIRRRWCHRKGIGMRLGRLNPASSEILLEQISSPPTPGLSFHLENGSNTTASCGLL